MSRVINIYGFPLRYVFWKQIKKKTKDGKKLKKKQLEEPEAQEDPDCEPPAPKKKKKKDKLKADQVNGQTPEASDLNGNINGVETPSKTEEDAKVGAAMFFAV